MIYTYIYTYIYVYAYVYIYVCNTHAHILSMLAVLPVYNPPAFPSHLSLGALGTQTDAPASGFLWVLRVSAEVLTLAKQAPYRAEADVEHTCNEFHPCTEGIGSFLTTHQYRRPL